MRYLWLAGVFLASSTGVASAQTTDGGFDKMLSASLASVARAMHSGIRANLADAARAMSDTDYAFRPTAETRTFGQLVGHIANANYFFCSEAAAERTPSTENYEALSNRAAVLKGLEESLAYCDRVYAATTDANFNKSVRMVSAPGSPPTDTVRGAVLMFNVTHNNEHYGNVVVYMRLRGRVPPSTARTQASQ